MPPEPAELAEKFPQLEILELLGQGGMGAVYKARQKQLDRLVALKILPPEVGQTEAFAERFTREARSMAKLHHPRIVTVFDFGQTADGLYYFIMEFIDGTDLRHVIQAGELSPDEALAIVPQVCEALHYAHTKGIVHRDIKPENILLDKEGNIKIADFGLVRLLDRPGTDYTLTQADQRMGTPHYMAPEQIEHPHEVDHRADIYSLGVVFYEMLTGELPLGRFAPPSQKVQIDVRLDEIVLHTLEKEPERRYQHASEVKTDVESIAGEARGAPPKEGGDPITGAEAALVRQSRATKISVAIVYCIILTAWVLMPFGMFDKQGLLDIKHWDLFAVPASLAWVVWFLLRRPGFKAAVPHKTRDRQTDKPRICKLPVIGALWAPFGLALLFSLLFVHTSTFEGDAPPARPAVWYGPGSPVWYILVLVVLPLGALAPFVSTTLGCLGISKIRSSQGQLIGMPLAVAVALFYPILVLDGILLFIAARLGDTYNCLMICVAVTALVILALDFFIIRALWKAVTKSPGEDLPERALDLSRKGKWNGFCIAGFLVSLVGILFCLREMDPGEDIPVRIIWGSSVVLSSVLAIVGLLQARKYQGMRCNGFGIAALILALAALVGFFVTIWYPVSW